MKKNIFKVMSDPRGFMRSLRKCQIGKVPLYLLWVIGMVYLIRQAVGYQLSLYFPYGIILLSCAILAIPFGFIILYLYAFFLFWAGKLFKGKATYGELVSAAGYGRVPEIFVVFAWLLLALVLGQATFSHIYVLNGLPPFIMTMLYVQIFFYIWEFVITLHTIGEVQGFSAWMAIWNCVLAGVIVVLISMAAQLLVSLTFSISMVPKEAAQTALNFLT